MITGDPRTDHCIELFRRAIHAEDRPVCQDMLNRAAAHACAASGLQPMEALVLAILLEREKDLCSLRNAGPSSD